MSKIESSSLPEKRDLYFYNPTKITDPSNDNYFHFCLPKQIIHKVDTALFKGVMKSVLKKMS